MPSLNHRPRRPDAHAEDDPNRPCDWPGCEGEGLYRAPRSRHELYVYSWFCLDHVRQ